MKLLSIGEVKRPSIVEHGLDHLLANHHLTKLLIDERDASDSHVVSWAKHGRLEPRALVHPWVGAKAMRRGTRPPAYGVDRLRAVLFDGLGFADRLMVWGDYACYGPDGLRRREWDVAVDDVLALAALLGWRGWWWSETGLRELA